MWKGSLAVTKPQEIITQPCSSSFSQLYREAFRSLIIISICNCHINPLYTTSTKAALTKWFKYLNTSPTTALTYKRMSDLSLTYKIFNIQCLFRRILLSFASKLQISLNHFIQDDINTYYFVNGVLQKTYAVENNPGLLNYSLNERERGKSAAQLFSEALWKVCTHFTHWQNINY